MSGMDIIKSAVIGHAVGDALGVPVEFMSREELQEHPVTDMLGYGSHNVPKGTWSDDTSMALCTLHSIKVQGKIDLDHIMQEFGKWLDNGYMTPYGEIFDIGRTCLHAIIDYHNGKDVQHCGGNSEYDNGNGSLMRIIPISLYNYIKQVDRNVAISNVHAVSALTHSHPRAYIACGIYDFVVQALIETPKKSSIKSALAEAYEFYRDENELKHYERLFSPDFELTPDNCIKSSGYVVDTLESAIWCLLNTDSYTQCVLKAVNLGEDTDTVAAVAGGLAGILYGYEQIPTAWINVLAKKQEIIDMCEKFYEKLTDKKQ